MSPRSKVALQAPEAVRRLVLDALRPLPPADVPSIEAAGLVLAEAVAAPFDLPRFANAAMDGYAVRTADTQDAPARLRIVGAAFAGRPWTGRLGDGEAVLIATGAVVPEGADGVAPVEDVSVEGDRVTVPGPVARGRHIRRAGEDVRAGDVVLEAGSVLGPAQLAAVTALGADRVRVHPRPRVAVMPTGDEVRPAGCSLGPGQVHDAVSAPLSSLIAEVGCIPILQPIAPDVREALDRSLAAATAAADAVITVGGVSMGERDLVRESGSQGDVRPFRLAMRPARPFAFGFVHGVPLFGLPGNPTATLAAFEELVRPALLAMLGKPPSTRPSIRAELAEPFSQPRGLLHLVRVELWREGGRLLARPSGTHGAGMVRSLARVQGWAVIGTEATDLPAGAVVEVRPLVEIP